MRVQADEASLAIAKEEAAEIRKQAELWKQQREGTLQLDNRTVQYIMALLTGTATEHETFVTIEDPDNKHLAKRDH